MISFQWSPAWASGVFKVAQVTNVQPGLRTSDLGQLFASKWENHDIVQIKVGSKQSQDQTSSFLKLHPTHHPDLYIPGMIIQQIWLMVSWTVHKAESTSFLFTGLFSARSTKPGTRERSVKGSLDEWMGIYLPVGSLVLISRHLFPMHYCHFPFLTRVLKQRQQETHRLDSWFSVVSSTTCYWFKEFCKLRIESVTHQWCLLLKTKL